MWHAWERIENYTRFWLESRKERDHLEDQGVGGMMGSEWILGRLAWGGVDWIQLAQDRDRWRAAVSAVMNLRVLAPHRLVKKYFNRKAILILLPCLKTLKTLTNSRR
jgi:hypothetical protein